tara:strand:+ start:485 stop:895 length:411 start_codon:yes stop_codon:yes gene_type:complete
LELELSELLDIELLDKELTDEELMEELDTLEILDELFDLLELLEIITSCITVPGGTVFTSAGVKVISPVIVFIVVMVTISPLMSSVLPIPKPAASLGDTVTLLLPAADCMDAVPKTKVFEEELEDIIEDPLEDDEG